MKRWLSIMTRWLGSMKTEEVFKQNDEVYYPNIKAAKVAKV